MSLECSSQQLIKISKRLMSQGSRPGFLLSRRQEQLSQHCFLTFAHLQQFQRDDAKRLKVLTTDDAASDSFRLKLMGESVAISHETTATPHLN